MTKAAENYTLLEGFERKVMPVCGVKVIDRTQGIVEAYISGIGNVDTGGDIVEPTFFESSLNKHLQKNPKGVYAHDWTWPVSKLVETETVPAGDDRLPEKLKAAGAGGQRVVMQYNMKVQRAVDAFNEVEFYGDEQEWSFGYVAIGAYKDKDGNRHLPEGEWYEYSQVLFGMNPLTATVGVKALAEQSDLTFDVALAKLRVMCEDETNGDTVRALIRDLGEGKEAGDVQNKKAIGRHKTDTSDAAWDGPASEANLSSDAGASTFRKVFAWVDPDKDADTKAAYRFVHHEVDSDGNVGAANVKACTTGIGVLNGGRGGTTIPDDDKQGVYDHLAGHITDSGADAPELKTDAPGEKKSVETKDLDAAGSFEDQIDRVSQAVNAWRADEYPEDQNHDVYAWTIATWPDRVVACVVDYGAGERTYYQFPYVTATNGDIALGAPTEVQLVTSIVPKSVEKLRALMTKEGRRHSSKDETALQSIHDAAIALGALCAMEEGKGSPVLATVDGKSVLTEAERMELETLAAAL